MKHHDRAIGLNPSYAEAWSNKGFVLNKLKDYPNALKHHDQTTAVRPTSAKVRVNKGLMYSKLEQRQDTIAPYDQAITLSLNLKENE